MGQYHRDISHGIQFVRALLLGRTWNSQNRFADQLTSRPYPKVNLPVGPANLASENQYYLRDSRRAVFPNQEIKKQITDGKEAPKKAGPPTPGKTYIY